eukprot:scaffold67260_cov28-Prasinocladus_malaysianus.AAC.3
MPRIPDNIHDVRTSKRDRTNRSGEREEAEADAGGNDNSDDNGGTDDEWDIHALQEQVNGAKGISSECLDDLLDSIASTEASEREATDNSLEDGPREERLFWPISSSPAIEHEQRDAARVQNFPHEAPAEFQRRW